MPKPSQAWQCRVPFSIPSAAWSPVHPVAIVHRNHLSQPAFPNSISLLCHSGSLLVSHISLTYAGESLWLNRHYRALFMKTCLNTILRNKQTNLWQWHFDIPVEMLPLQTIYCIGHETLGRHLQGEMRAWNMIRLQPDDSELFSTELEEKRQPFIPEIRVKYLLHYNTSPILMKNTPTISNGQQ